MKITKRFVSIVLFLVGLFTVMAVGSAICMHDDAAGRTSFSVLEPIVTSLRSSGEYLTQRTGTNTQYLGAALLLIALLSAVLAWRQTANRYISLAALCAFGTALSFLLERADAGFVCAGILLLMALVFRRWSAHMQRPGNSETFTMSDALVGLLIVLLGSFFRFYALNRVPSEFEGELSAYMLGSTSLRGMFQANEGIWGPWAPLGILYYIPIYILYLFGGSTLLVVRLGSAVISILTLGLLFLVLRLLYSRSAAIFGGLLLALEPLQIGWGRTDVHPHGSTSWIGILIMFFTVRALQKDRLRDFLLLVPLMALSWHQYPSGQVSVFIPIVAFGYALLTGQVAQARLKKAGVLLGGLFVWFAGAPVLMMIVQQEFRLTAYFDKLGTRIFYQQTGNDPGFYERVADTTARAGQHAWDLLLGLFWRPPYLHHQDLVPFMEPYSPRTIMWVTAAGLVLFLGLFLPRRRDPSWYVPLLWCFISFLPSVFSDSGVPKRASNGFPALCLLGGLAFSYFDFAVAHAAKILALAWRGLVAGALVCVSLIWTEYYFLSGRIESGENCDTIVSRKIENVVRPRTIMIVRVKSYMEGKFLYLFKDFVEEKGKQPRAIYLHFDGDIKWTDLLRDPRRALDYLEQERYHLLWSQLIAYKDEWRKSCWENATIVLELRQFDSDEDKAEQQARWDELEAELKRVGSSSQVLTECKNSHFVVANIPLGKCEN